MKQKFASKRKTGQNFILYLVFCSGLIYSRFYWCQALLAFLEIITVLRSVLPHEVSARGGLCIGPTYLCSTTFFFFFFWGFGLVQLQQCLKLNSFCLMMNSFCFIASSGHHVLLEDVPPCHWSDFSHASRRNHAVVFLSASKGNMHSKPASLQFMSHQFLKYFFFFLQNIHFAFVTCKT